jgi:hypothetical protein
MLFDVVQRSISLGILTKNSLMTGRANSVAARANPNFQVHDSLLHTDELITSYYHEKDPSARVAINKKVV